MWKRRKFSIVAFSCDRALFALFFAAYFSVAGAFCRFVGHVRDLIVSLSRNDKEQSLNRIRPRRGSSDSWRRAAKKNEKYDESEGGE